MPPKIVVIPQGIKGQSNLVAYAPSMTKIIGPRARQVTLPIKIDDAFISGALTEESFETALKYARREVQ